MVKDADLLLHVIDCSHEMANEQEEAVYQVLQELGVTDKPMLKVYNKIDKLEHQEGLVHRLSAQENTLCVSAKTGEGIPELLQAIAKALGKDVLELSLCIPYDKTKLAAQLHEEATVLSEEYGEKGVMLKIRLAKDKKSLVEPYILEEVSL